MKRTTKLTAVIALSVAATALTAFTASGCKGNRSQSQGAPYYDTLTVYAQAQELGYNGTLDEFIAMISGKDGENGDKGETGEKGDKGDDGVGVKSGYIDEDGHLILTLTDDSEIDCGAIGKSHEHTFGDWITIKEADCTNAGLKIRGCENCTHAEHIVLPSIGHDWSDWTFLDNVRHLHICGICHETESVPHAFEDGVCTDCGYTTNIVFALPLAEINIKTRHMDRHPTLMLLHSGLDLAASADTEVFAVMDGTVKSIVLDNPTSGDTITIEHVNGYQTVYRFVHPVEGLAVGDTVTQSDVIGLVSTNQGNEFNIESHIHFELLKDGKSVDPEDYIDFSAE